MNDAYAQAGVDTHAGEEAVRRIKQYAEETFSNWSGNVLGGVGGFGAILEHENGTVSGYSTDGVGTKLLLAIILDKHDTVGQDLVAMCSNDLAMVGIQPTVFLDYMAMGRQDPVRTEQVIKGIAKACGDSGAALIGGEMAEMPGMYDEDHYDLAGFAVGFAQSKEDLVTGKNIQAGMKIWGHPSNGIHTNGFSLIRKVFGIDHTKPDAARAILETHYDELGTTLGEELMKPTHLYPKTVSELLGSHDIAGLAHITGGGLIENPPRIMPEGLAARIDLSSWERQPIFDLIQETGGLSESDMYHAFNYGIGFIAITNDDLPAPYVHIGEVVESDTKDTQFS